MAKYNIQKATGRALETSKSDSMDKDSDLEAQSVITIHNENTGEAVLGNDLKNKLNLFDTIVSHSYLRRLTECPIVMPVSDALSPMGWYRITKIVLDGETFFPDQLSMLYTALHNVAKNVALVIEKKSYDEIEIYLGARDFNGNYHDASTLLASSIQGYLPGVKVESQVDKQFLVNPETKKYVASFSGVASLRDDKKEDFIQGIEKFIDATPSIPSFTALFIADNVSQEQVRDMIRAYSSLEDAFSPLMQYQETMNESQTEGISETITNSISETITESLSETVTRTEGTNESYSKNSGTSYGFTENKSPNIFRSFVSSIIGGMVGSSTSNNTTEQTSEQTGKHADFSQANQKGKSTGTSNGKSTADGKNSSATVGRSRQITHTNSAAKQYVDLLSTHIERLQSGISFGLWSIGTYFVSPNDSTSKKLANIYRGCVTGEESYIDTNAVNVWNESQSKTILEYLRRTQNPRFLIDSVNISPGELVTSKELAIHMSLPQTSIPGVEVRECATFGRNLNNKKGLNSNQTTDQLRVGFLSHLGNVSTKEVTLDMAELSKHVFVTGSTGSGKSNTVYLLAQGLLDSGKNVLVIEPTKGDYRKVFGGRKDVTVYGTRSDERNLLTLNPFAFPVGVKVVEHVERLIEIFGVCWPMYAAMPAVLKDSILNAYKACGWNLKNSICLYGKLFPTIPDVVKQLKLIVKSTDYSADTKGDYIGALQTRLESLTNGVYASMFSSSASVPYEDLYDKNVIIDLHRIGSSETRSLLMGLLILGLTEWRMSGNEDEMDQDLHHVTILEEAHCILPRVSKQQSQEGANVVGKSVEMIASAIAEMRTYGESFIIVDQSPSAVDEAAIRNTNTKIIMNLPDGNDREIAGKSIALTKEAQILEIARLSTGEAIVWQRGWSEAIMTIIDEMTSKTPLSYKDNLIVKHEEKAYKPSDLFKLYFIDKQDISIKDRKWLEMEILGNDCPSTIKAELLDCLFSKVYKAKASMHASVLDFLGITSFIKQLLVNSSEGSSDLVWELRAYFTNHLDIIDTDMQNKLLSMSFTWASSQNNKWYAICKDSLPGKNPKNKLYGISNR